MKIISGLLLLVSVYLSFQHGWAGLAQNFTPEQANLMAELGINKPLLTVTSSVSLAVGVLLLFPQTFLVGNLLSAAGVLLLMGLALNTGNLRLAAIEVPFLLLPLALIWLKHPLAR
ncbi:hypothetical protein [Hymenobacter sp. YC55]|uniref:hypothetical protein n=1 Tax=Hymenobacter sp. YC55 TaxID=3034019 RepID=UPI0023F7FF39|nr:hypothetical protein [Hymenobacter sp. YC55]MDF7813901.1 hypothetical protein [Hymenobacter sp. YC55]